MHLLALLIAAVFSSQFTAPNAITAISEVTPALKDLDILLGLPALEITVDAPAVGTLTWTLKDTAEGGEPVPMTAHISVSSPTTKYVSVADVDVSALIDGTTGIPGSIDLTVVEDGAGTVPPKSLDITPVGVYTVNVDDTIALVEVGKMPQLTFASDDKYRWHGAMKARVKVNTTKVLNFPIVKAGEGVSATYKTAGGEDITTFGITWANIGDTTMTVDLVLREAATGPPVVTEVLHPEQVDITLERAPFVQFDVQPTTLLPADKIAAKQMTVAPVEGVTWTTGTQIFAIINREGTTPPGAAAVTWQVAEPASGATRWNFTADIASLTLTEVDTELYVWLKVTGVVLDKPFEVKYDGVTTPTGEFSLDPPSFTYEQMKGKATKLKFVDESEEVGRTEWTTPMKAKFTYNNVDKLVDVAKVTGPPVTWEIAALDLDSLSIPIAGATVTVALAPKPVTGNIKYLADTVDFVIAPKVAVFSINIEEIQQSAIAAVAFSLTPEAGAETTAWKATGITVHATFSPTSAIPAVVGDYTFELTPPASGATAFTGTADLTGFNFAGLTENKIYVWAMLDDGTDQVWRDVPKTVTFVPSTDPVFTLNITGIKEEDMKTIAVEVTPNPLTAFDEEVIKIGFTTTETQVTTDPAAILTVEQDEADDKWKASGDITKLVISPVPTNVYVWIKIGDEWLAHKVTLTFTATPPAEFTITPAKATEGKLAKADSDAYTIGIISTTSKPAKATKSKVVFTAGAKTLTVEFAPTGETPDHTWVIAAGECDFASLTIATFPTVGKVAFHPDKDGAALGPAIPFTFEAAETPGGAAMGASPLLSLLAALVFLFVKLF